MACVTLFLSFLFESLQQLPNCTCSVKGAALLMRHALAPQRSSQVSLRTLCASPFLMLAACTPQKIPTGHTGTHAHYHTAPRAANSTKLYTLSPGPPPPEQTQRLRLSLPGSEISRHSRSQSLGPGEPPWPALSG